MLSIINLYLSVTIAIIVLLYFHLTRNFNHWKNKNIPYVKPVPIFGNVFKVITFKRSIGQLLSDVYKSSKSPYVGFFVFDQPFLLVRDPELIKAFLVKDFDYFNDRSVMENKHDDESQSNILFIVKNPAWRQLRTKLSPAFSTGKIKSMIPLMVNASNDLVDYINQVAVVEKSSDARDISMKYTTDVIASCAFGISAQSFKHENSELRIISNRIVHLSFGRSVQMASHFFAPILVRLFRMKMFDPSCVRFIKEVFWKTLNEREISGVYRGDLIDILMKIRKENDDPDCVLDRDKLAMQAVMFFVGGYEPTGTAISFTLYELSLNPSVQDRLRTEIISVLNKFGEISYEALQEMNYLDMVLNETLRKYPSLPFLDRRCAKTYKIPNTDVIIEKGIPIYVSLLGLHNDPEYFPNPERYDPDRFSYENRKTRPAFTFMPFGEGLHNCVAARFGILSFKVALVSILSKFEVEICEDTPVPLKMAPKGFVLTPESTLSLHFKPHLPDSMIPHTCSF